MRKRYTLIDLIFILIGGKFYMDWILLTNPVSKNPLCRSFIKLFNLDYNAYKYKRRYTLCFNLIVTHIVMMILMFIIPDQNFITNLLVNIYPIIVNTYIALRLKKVINHKNTIKYSIS